ncbi:MAG: hypothetical protein PF572_04190 [Patescibacteria group bacterium]|jgi:predicted CopG family antitoxin|nr:hypothetical protein [Patescibacteria group bacterium]
MHYSNEEKLVITKLVGITKDVYDVLRKEKRKQKISMAKIVCNLILDKFN